MLLRKAAAVFWMLLLCLTATVCRAELTAGAPEWVQAPGLVCPGEERTFEASVPAGTTGTVTVLDIADTEVARLQQQWSGGTFTWDGYGL